jgi:hypothetical protein
MKVLNVAKSVPIYLSNSVSQNLATNSNYGSWVILESQPDAWNLQSSIGIVAQRGYDVIVWTIAFSISM